MTKETLDDIREVIGTLSVCMSYKSINNITSIPTYDLLHQVNILKKLCRKISIMQLMVVDVSLWKNQILKSLKIA